MREAVETPVVSVILITYNHEGYVVQAIESVLAQDTTFPYEVLITEDCSTDATREIVKEYRRRYPGRIRLLLSERNQRDNDVETRALMAARGKYIALLEGDDYWTSSSKLQRQVEFLDCRPELSICFHNVQTLYEAGGCTALEHPRTQPVMTLRDLFRDAYLRFYTCSMMLRNGAVSEYPEWYRSIVPSDWALTLLYAEHGSVGYIDEIMAVYRVHAGGIWSALDTVARCQDLLRCDRVFSKHFGKAYQRLIRRGAAKHWYALAVAQYQQGQTASARTSIEGALAEWPFNTRALLFRYAFWIWAWLKSRRISARNRAWVPATPANRPGPAALR